MKFLEFGAPWLQKIRVEDEFKSKKGHVLVQHAEMVTKGKDAEKSRIEIMIHCWKTGIG